MKTLEESSTVDGISLHRTCYLPDGPPRATAVLLHGQGDFVSRYAEVTAIFQEHGIAVVGCDLPGHGSSPGRRGHIPGFSFIDQVVKQDRSRCHELAPGAPIGLLGHSCGGLMALRELLRNPGDWNYSWISSPLVHPEGTRPAWEAWFFLFVARLFPFLSIDIGVGPKECINDGPDQEARLGEMTDENRFHRRITLSWTRAVCDAAREVRANFRSLPPIPILFTQGEDDPVCRAETLA